MVAKEARPAGNAAMILETGAGWKRGMSNVLRGELRRWFRTSTWWRQILIWAASINLIFLLTSVSAPRDQLPASDSLMIFNIFMGLAGPIGVSIIMQSAVVGEKRSGTAAWVLSKPVSRQAFILAKIFSSTIGLTVTMLLAQGLIAYLIAGLLLGLWLPVGGFLLGLGAHLINIFFYLTLTLMLGTIFEHTAPVIGIPLALLFSQNFLGGFYPPLMKVLPWTLAIPPNNSQAPSIAMALMSGTAPASYLPAIVSLGAALVFVAIGLWVFSRQEL
jgi:ABC-2 type transport system permease protein